ncbi:MAG: hypothetical protein AAF497_11175 [Planctomycetota bacterium]
MGFDTVTTTYQGARLMAGDPYLIHRIVGYHEYSQALRRLSRFVEASTQPELAAAEQIVKDEAQYLVYPIFGQLPELEEDEAYALGRDITLSRLIGFARVEVASMLAGFAKSPSPFESVSATPYDFEAFKEFVFEGARMQFEALRDDKTLRPQFPPTKLTLAQLRRLNIARHLVAAATILAAH